MVMVASPGSCKAPDSFGGVDWWSAMTGKMFKERKNEINQDLETRKTSRERVERAKHTGQTAVLAKSARRLSPLNWSSPLVKMDFQIRLSNVFARNSK